MTPVQILFAAAGLDAVKSEVLGLVPIFDRMGRSARSSVEASAKAEVRAQTDATKQIAKDAERAAKDRERQVKDGFRGVEQALKDELRLREQVNAVEVRGAQQAANERTRILKSEASQAESILRQRSRGFGSAVGRSTSRVLGMAGRVAGVAAAIGGGFTIADSLASGISDEKIAGQLVRSSAETGGLTGADVQGAARASAIATGTSKSDNLEGIDRFIRETGDLKTGVELMKDLARYSAASGASMTDLGTTAGTIFTHMNGDVGETKATLLALIGQSKTGAIDIRNLAQYGGRLVGSAELFEGGTKNNIETFGALAQLAKRKGGKIDAAEATESAARIFGEVSMHADDFTGMGVNVKGAGGKLRSVEDILLDTLVKTKGDITAIPHLFGRQAGGVETGLAQSFLEGSGGKTDDASLAAGRRAAAASIQALRRPSNEGEIDEGVKAHLAETNAQLAIATEKFHAAVNGQLLPLMPGLIDKFAQLIPPLERFLQWIIDSPKTAIGSLVGAAIVGEITKIGLAALVESLFTKMAAAALGRLAIGQVASTVASGTLAATAGTATTAAATAGSGAALTAAEGAGTTAAAGAIGGGIGLVGGGVIGATLLSPLGFAYLGQKREEKGDKHLADIMSMPTESEEQKKSKLSALEDLEFKGQSRTTYDELALKGQENDVFRFQGGNDQEKLQARRVGADVEGEAYKKQLTAITEEVANLKAALSGAAPAITAFAESLPKKEPGTGWGGGEKY